MTAAMDHPLRKQLPFMPHHQPVQFVKTHRLRTDSSWSTGKRGVVLGSDSARLALLNFACQAFCHTKSVRRLAEFVMMVALMTLTPNSMLRTFLFQKPAVGCLRNRSALRNSAFQEKKRIKFVKKLANLALQHSHSHLQ